MQPLTFLNDQVLVIVDTLPVGTTWQNGLPIAPGGALCITTDPVATWQNGVPLASNGAVSVVYASVADFYVSSITGVDSNDGTSPASAFATFAPLNLLSTAALTGKAVAVQRGSTITSMFTTAAPSLRLTAYGTGSDPVLECRDPISAASWTPHGTYANCYVCTIALPGDTKIKGNAWVNGVIIPQVATEAACGATSGTCFVTDWTAASTTLMINSATDPRVDGKAYLYSARASGINFSGDYCIVEDVTATGNAHQDGSIRLSGWYCTLRRSKATQGNRHNVYAGPGFLMEDCEIRSGRNDLEGSANTLVVNAGSSPGVGYTSRRNRYVGSDYVGYGTGPLQHDGTPTNRFGTQISQDDVFVDLISWGTFAGDDSQVIRPTFTRVTGGALLGADGTKLTVTDVVPGATINQLYNVGVGGQIITARNTEGVPLLGTGFYRYNAGSTNLSLIVSNEKLTISSGTAFGNNSQVIRHARGAVSVYDFNVTQPNDEPLCAPIDAVMAIGFSAASTYQGDRNFFPYGSQFQLNGTTYNTLAEWQAATGQDLTSVVRQPVPAGGDDFNRPDENLEANAFWIRLGGAAAQAAVRSNALACIGTTQTLYYHDSGKSDNWISFVVAQVPATAGPYMVIRATDQNNWVGIRWTTTTWQIGHCIAGVLTTAALGSSAVAPAVGQFVVLAIKGSQVWLYVNGRTLVRSGTLSIGSLPAGTFCGVVPRGYAVNPFIDSFSYGTVNS